MISDVVGLAWLEAKQAEAVKSLDANWSQRKQAFVRHLDAAIFEIKTQAARRSDYAKTVEGAKVE